MKKIYLLAFALMTGLSYGQFSENFDAAVAMPSGWTSYIGTNGEGPGQNWSVIASTRAYSPGNCAFVRYEVVSTSAEDWLVTPLIDLTSYTGVSLSFWGGQQYSADYSTSYTVRVSTTSQTDITSFTTVATYAEADFATTTPISTQKTVDLSAYNGQQIYVAFVMTQNDGDNWFIDDVAVTGTLSTTDFHSNLKTSLYPNPTKGEINIQSPEAIETVEVYGILGNLIKTCNGLTKIDLTDLNTGTYMVKIKSTEGNISTQKVIKN